MSNAKYKQIEEHFIQLIESGALKYGDQIKTEEQLCQEFGCSRMTVNKAMNNLNQLGYITRAPGKGSFVRIPSVAKDSASITSFTEDMKKIGLKAGSKLLSYNVISASEVPEIRDKLQLSNSDMIHYIIRLRTGNGIPFAISYGYISARIIPAIDISSLNSSFYAYLDEIGIPRLSKEMEITACIPDDFQKEHLEISNTALLCATHLTYTLFENEIKPFEYIKTYYNGDRYTYTTD